MPWNLNITGTPGELMTAVSALVGADELEQEVLSYFNQVALSQINANLAGKKSALFLQGPLQLKLIGRVDTNKCDLSLTIQVVRLDQFGNIVGGSPPPINTTVTTVP